jgi:ankyrin repeat protein
VTKSFRSFDRMIIPAPCDADWDAMAGNDRVRFCEHCNLHVTNLSNITRQEAIRLVAQSEGRLCVRFVKRADGSVLSKQSPQRLHHIARRVSRIAAGAFTATLSLSSAAAQTGSTSSSLPTEQAVAPRALSPVEAGCTLSGIVADPNGAVVSGATVTLTDLKGGSFFTFITADDGAYKFSMLPAGSYSLTAAANSFQPTGIDKIELTDGAERSMNLELKIPEIVVETEISGEVEVVQFSGGGAIAFVEPVEPLVRAAFKEELEEVKLLAFSASDLDVRDKYTSMTALEQATENGNLEIVRTLLLAGANANAKNESGRTALMYLRESATADLVRELISGGAKIDEQDESGGTALMNAASQSNFEAVKELVDRGAKIDLRDADGKTALMFAAENRDPRVSKILIDAGANVRTKATDGKTPLMIAASEGDPETVKLLISFNADINERDQSGWSALMFAVMSGDEISVDALLNAGADLSFRDNARKTALGIARQNDDADMIKLLESRGAPN